MSTAVSMELHHEIEQRLYTEARILDQELGREWLETLVDPEIRYQLVMMDERFKKDKASLTDREIFAFDDDFAILNLRVAQAETGMQTMLDPAQRMYRMLTNIQSFSTDVEGEYRVLSYGTAARYRRQYEREMAIYARDDLWRRDETGQLRLLKRRIELGERVVRNKNLLFFL